MFLKIKNIYCLTQTNWIPGPSDSYLRSYAKGVMKREKHLGVYVRSKESSCHVRPLSKSQVWVKSHVWLQNTTLLNRILRFLNWNDSVQLHREGAPVVACVVACMLTVRADWWRTWESVIPNILPFQAAVHLSLYVNWHYPRRWIHVREALCMYGSRGKMLLIKPYN